MLASLGAAVGTETFKALGAAVGVGVGIWVGVWVGASVWPSTVGAAVNMTSRGVMVGMAVVKEGAGVKVPFTMMHGASTPSTQNTPPSRMIAEQQSDEPSVPRIEPQPSPPQTPLQASAQQTLPSWTPASPFGHIDGVTSVAWGSDERHGEKGVSKSY